jgi:16S rRNA (cytidine1402-2'-O)-methyltransferase
LGEETAQAVSPELVATVKELKFFIVEDEKPARHFIKTITGMPFRQPVHWILHNEHETTLPETLLHEWLKSGESIGVISGAGSPGIADPGTAVAAFAHRSGYDVVPLAGSSSIFLALMASGLNGQKFSFKGYLPVDSRNRELAIRQAEEESRKQHCTVIFIETPYRNQALLTDVLRLCTSNTRLCIAAGLHTASQFLKTRRIHEWKQLQPDLHKKPCVFLLQAE